MPTSASAHAYYTSIRVVHNYLPKELRVRLGETLASPAVSIPIRNSLTAMTMKEYGSFVPNTVTHQ